MAAVKVLAAVLGVPPPLHAYVLPPVAVTLILVVVQESAVVPVLLVMPGVTGVHTPGTVVTLLVGLTTKLSVLHIHRVSTVMGVVWL